MSPYAAKKIKTTVMGGVVAMGAAFVMQHLAKTLTAGGKMIETEGGAIISMSLSFSRWVFMLVPMFCGISIAWTILKASLGDDDYYYGEPTSNTVRAEYYPEIDKAEYSRFIKKFEGILPELYSFTYKESQDLLSDKVFILDYEIRMDKILVDFLIKSGVVKDETGHYQYKIPSFLEGEEHLIMDGLPMTATNKYSNPEERTTIITKLTAVLKKSSLACCYEYLKNYDELVLENIFCMDNNRPESRVDKKDEYTINHNFSYGENGSIGYSCSIEFKNDMMGQRFLSKGIDAFIRESHMYKVEGVADEKSFESQEYQFDNVLSLYVMLMNLNNNIQKFVNQEAKTVYNYLREEVKGQISKEFNTGTTVPNINKQKL